jgi:hypothetical protein
MKKVSHKNQITAAWLALFASLAASPALADVSCENIAGGFPIVKAFQLSGEVNNAAIVLQTENSKTLLIGEFMTGHTRVGEFVSYIVKDSNEIESRLDVQIDYQLGWKACGRGSCIPDLDLVKGTLKHGGQTYALTCENIAF